MDTSEQNTNLLRKWLDNTLSPEEAAIFKKSKEYEDYKKIVETVDNFRTPSGDQEKVLSKIYENAQKKPTKIRTLPYWITAGAAVAAILVLLFVFRDSSIRYATDFGEQMAITLPDGSKVKLNAKTEISFEEKNWMTNREIFLKGEAFFEVEKGSDFIVKSKNGYVKVLGTKFTALSQQSFFEVVCYEGMVQAGANDQKAMVLSKGNALRSTKEGVEQWNTSGSSPSWLTRESSFTDAPLSMILVSLEKQYNIQFETGECVLNRRYTGSYTHSDLEKALKTVFKPMGIPYTNKENQLIILCTQ